MKNTINKFYPILLITLIIGGLSVLSSCDLSVDNTSDNSSGKTNEMILVINKASLLRSPLSDTVKSFFEESQPWLPQPEPFFDVTAIPEKQFKASGFMKKHHNILMVSINPATKKSFVETRKDLWAKPQRVIKFNVDSDTAFYRLFNEYKHQVMEMFDDIEIERTIKTMKLATDYTLATLANEKFGMNISIPGGFSLTKDKDNFLWITQQITRTKQEVSVGLVLYQYPYTNTNCFEPQSIIAVRDSVCKKYINGPAKNSYMKTATSFIPPHSEVTSKFTTEFAVETRGLWELEGDFMGGPFVSYSFVNPNTQMVVTIEGFVYNPNNKKATYLRQLQAVMHTISFPEIETKK